MEIRKTFYEEPKIEVIQFDMEDVIATSNEREPAELEEIED